MRKLLYGTTASISAWSFFVGLDHYLFKKSVDISIVSGDIEFKEKLESRGFSAFIHLALQREISFQSDFFSLIKGIIKIYQIKPDVSHVLTPKAGLILGLANFFARTPARVYAIAGLRLETTSGLKRLILWVCEWLACKVAHEIICVSYSLKHRVIELGLTSPEKVIVLNSGSINGIDVSKFEASAARLQIARQIRSELNIPLDGSVIGFVGRLTRDKGISELINGFQKVQERFPDTYLLILGDYESGDPVSHQTRELVESLPHVIKLGFVVDVSRYYHVFDMLVLPTYREGFPNVSLEAAAGSKPVITTTATGARDSVLPNETGLIVPIGNSLALADAMSYLLQNRSLALKMGIAGHSWVKAEFQSEQIWEATYRLYTSLYERRLKIKRNRSLVLKRLFDIAASAIGLVLLAPVLLILYCLISRKMGSPALFTQQRPGLHGKPFTMYKFRTMTNARDMVGDLLPDADRLTSFGKWLRSTSLDELPELWNILCGDMSLVGPRPLLIEYLERYTPEQAQRHEVKPGLTGWAQVNGRNTISWEEKFDLDTWYVKNQSFFLDVKILLQTVLKVLKRDGISATGEATMPVFKGQQEQKQ